MFDQWVCTDPDKSRYDPVLKMKTHPRMWELETQKDIRTMKVRGPDERVILGVEPSLMQEDGPGSRAVQGGDVGGVSYFGLDSDRSAWIIFGVALACRYQGKGEGSIAVGVTLIAMSRSGIPDPPSDVFARIHPANDPSRRAFRSNGFEYVDLREGYELWGREL